MPSTLILAEHTEGQLKSTTLSAVKFAQQVKAITGSEYDILIVGHSNESVAQALIGYGARQILSAEHASLKEPLAHTYAEVVRKVAMDNGCDLIVGAASTFTKDILPRAAGLLDAGMLSDVIAVEPQGAGFRFQRVLFAGNVIATVELSGAIRCLTVRSSAFPAPNASSTTSSIVLRTDWDFSGLPSMEFVSRERRASTRPDATEARLIVSGGRAMKNSEDFERLVGGLADALGAAVGSSRALVDAGITPNSLQIGQTGKIVAPELYIALGISGAIQHMAGMKDTKVIVAINKDPDAAIFEVADYGLVADVYQAVPEWIAKARLE